MEVPYVQYKYNYQLNFSNNERNFASLIYAWIIHTNYMFSNKMGIDNDQQLHLNMPCVPIAKQEL